MCVRVHGRVVCVGWVCVCVCMGMCTYVCVGGGCVRVHVCASVSVCVGVGGCVLFLRPIPGNPFLRAIPGLLHCLACLQLAPTPTAGHGNCF